MSPTATAGSGGSLRKVRGLKVREESLHNMARSLLREMPLFRCRKHTQNRETLKPCSFYAAAKELGQNQSFQDFFIEEVQRSIGQQPSVVSDLFAFPLGTHGQEKNWPATTGRLTCSPVSLFSLVSYRMGEERWREPGATVAKSSS